MTLSNTRLADGTEAGKSRPPTESLLLASAGVLPIAIGAAACWIAQPDPIIHATIIWSGAILCFLGGVRRGLAFRQPGGPTLGELATMFTTFVIGLLALLSPWTTPALGLLILGYAEVAVTDRRAARKQEAPAYFATLRPPQIAVALLALAILLARAATTA